MRGPGEAGSFLGGDERVAGLRRMKAVATGAFVAVAVLFAVARSLDGAGWRATESFAEAAMVGALADWFAVTALFRRPLGLPIPHTAIVPARKDQIGRSLGRFVHENFLSPDDIAERVRQAGIVRRATEWLSEPGNDERVARTALDLAHSALTAVDQAKLRRVLDEAVGAAATRIDLAPLAGRVGEAALADEHFDQLLDAAVRGVERFVRENRAMLRERLDRESPWWVPHRVDDHVFERLYGGALRLLDEVGSDRAHPMRAVARRRLAVAADRLRNDPDWQRRGEELKERWLAAPATKDWLGTAWADLLTAATAATARPDGDLHRRVTGLVRGAATRLAGDPAMQQRIETTIERAARHLVERYGVEAARTIEATVGRWDAQSTSRKLELQVGRDLQYIRINGTLIGGLAGLAIHVADRALG